MPLIESSKKAALLANTKELVKAGHPPAQAYAIAKKTQREAAGKKAAK